MPTDRALPADSDGPSPIRPRDALAIALQIFCWLPVMAALAAYAVRAPAFELGAIAFGVVGFVVSALDAAITLLPGFRSKTRRTVFVLLFGQLCAWLVWMAVSGGDRINM